MAPFLGSKGLKPFISKGLEVAINSPIKFVSALAGGHEAWMFIPGFCAGPSQAGGYVIAKATRASRSICYEIRIADDCQPRSSADIIGL